MNDATDRMRIGVVGTGYWAEVVHAAGAGEHPGVDLVGVWGRDLGKAQALADRHQARGYDDFDAFLDAVDLITFAVPPHVQADLALRAARAGKHLLLEKPITLDLDAADRLVAAAEEASVSTVVFFTQRFVPVWEEWLNEAASRPLAGGRADWLAVQAGSDSPFADSRWRREEGALWDVGPHQVAQLVPALGPVTAIVGSRGAGDLVHLLLTHESGATSRMSLCLTMPPGADRIEVQFYGEGGWLDQPEHERDVADAYARALTELLDNVATGTTRHRCDVQFGRDVVELLARCERELG